MSSGEFATIFFYTRLPVLTTGFGKEAQMVRDGVHYTTPQCESFCSNNYNNLTPWSLKCKWEGNWCSSCSKCRELGIQPATPTPLNMQLLCKDSAEKMDQREIAVALKEVSVDVIVQSFDLLEEHCKKQMERVYPLPLLLSPLYPLPLLLSKWFTLLS